MPNPSPATSFDVQVRTLECPGCGAPISAPRAGGPQTCGYCSASFEVTARTPSARAHVTSSVADEIARTASLNAQAEHPSRGNPYDLDHVPPGLSLHPTTEELVAAWKTAGAAPVTTPEDGHRVCWLAIRLADAYVSGRMALQGRVVLETALDRLPDDGHRHLVRCQLTVLASDEGDFAAAAGWLGECDPAPPALELDTAYRQAAARMRLASGDAAGVVAVLGALEGDAPFLDTQASVGVRIPLRLQALELLGRDTDVDRGLRELEGAKWTFRPAFARGVFEEIEARGFLPRGRQRAVYARAKRATALHHH